MNDKRRLAAIMFTDIVGYSAMTQSNESRALDLLKEHNEILRPIFYIFRGREIKTIGDAFLVEFTNVLEGVQCAVECQRVLFERNQTAPVERKIEIRIGIHVGDVVYRDKDVFGDGVNIAARVQPLAEPGGICISEDVARQIQNKIEIPVVGLGAGELKNIKMAVAIFKILLPWKQKKLSFFERVKVTVGNRHARNVMTGVGVVIILLFLAFRFEVLKIGSGSGLKLNPNMSFKPYQIPFKQIGAISLSKDGNWLAFEAADKNDRWDIFVMDTKGTNIKRITNDSGLISTASIDISPDGSQILIHHNNFTKRKRELVTVPFLGGTTRVISDSVKVYYPKWSPDGKRIGVIRGDQGNEFVTIDPENSNYRSEFVDTTNNESYAFDWSPDGNSVAWLRTYERKYQEIVIHNLHSHDEKIITSQKATIWDLNWSEGDVIVYSTNVSGQYNLWAVSANGGEPVQITKGGGPDLSMSVSTDGKKMVYLQNSEMSDLWTAHIDGSGARQTTSIEMAYYDPRFSPDKSRIAFTSPSSDLSVRESYIYTMDRDGGNVQQLTSKTSSYLPVWSPDGQKIGYTTNVFEPTFKRISCYVNLQNPKDVNIIGEGEFSDWFDNEQVIIKNYISRKSFLVSTADTSKKMDLLADSTFVSAKSDKKTIFYYDFRQMATMAIRVPATASTLDVLAGRFMVKPVLVRKGLGYIFPDLDFVTDQKVESPGILWSITSSGRKTKLGEFANLVYVSNLDISADGKDVVYSGSRFSAKLFLVENFH